MRYFYLCDNCGDTERDEPMAAPALAVCPDCGGRTRRRIQLPSATRVVGYRAHGDQTTREFLASNYDRFKAGEVDHYKAVRG